jgi:cysteine desulfurase
MGIPPETAQTAVRFSFDTTVAGTDLESAAAAVLDAVGRVRALGG